MELNSTTELPGEFADVPAAALADELDGPTLFDLRKVDQSPLFISVLMHGDEVSGWDAVRGLVAELADASVMVFVGNVEAARQGVRALPGQVDFNRVWEGGAGEDAVVAEEVTARVATARPHLAIDVHNNTGENPPYSVICRTDEHTLAVAATFAERALLATQPHGFQTRRFARFCTAVTIEVGTPDDPSSADRARTFLARALTDGPALGNGGAKPHRLSLFETVARVGLTDDAVIEPRMQRFNFRSVPAGTAFTRVGALTAIAEDGRDICNRYFTQTNGAAVLKRPAIIAMYTGNPDSARSDCLCYFLKPIGMGNPLQAF